MSKIDIIIPVYNCAGTIGMTVKSLQQSGLQDFSIIIVNDGSNDDTEEVCMALEKQYKNVLHVNQKNSGVSSARNKGIELSTGKYLLFFDGDDSVDKGSLNKINQIIRDYDPDMLIFGMSFDYYYKGKIFRSEKKVYSEEGLYSYSEIQANFSELYNSNSLTSSCNKFIRRSLIIENSLKYPKDMFLMEDFIFSLDCLKYCEKIYMLPQAIYRYHQSEDEGNVYRRMKKICSLTDFVKPFEERLTEHPEVITNMYFMLLRQKLWNAEVSEIRNIAQDHLKGNFIPKNEEDKKLCNDLEKGKYRKIWIANKKLQGRHKIANIAKRTKLYQKLKMKGF